MPLDDDYDSDATEYLEHWSKPRNSPLEHLRVLWCAGYSLPLAELCDNNSSLLYCHGQKTCSFTTQNSYGNTMMNENHILDQLSLFEDYFSNYSKGSVVHPLGVGSLLPR